MSKRILPLKADIDTLRWFVAVPAFLALCACWNGRDPFRPYLDEGHARAVPLIVYDFTSNNPTSFAAAPLGFAFVNTQAGPIDSVDVELLVCNTMGQAAEPLTFKLAGPFAPGTSYVIAPLGPVDAKGRQEHTIIPHATVTAITIMDAGGTHVFKGAQVAPLLDGKIANYCIARAM